MADSSEPAATLGAAAARQLANTTKTPPQWVGTTPRWLVSLLPWVPVEAGTYRVNKVKEADAKGIGIECSPSDGAELPHAFVDYDEAPREYTLSTVTTTLEVQTRISDLYRSPMDQVREQLSVLIEMVKERQENELINNANYGLLASAAPDMRLQTRGGAPTPDDMDELLTKVWKEPAFFLAHPRAIAAFGLHMVELIIETEYEVAVRIQLNRHYGTVDQRLEARRRRTEDRAVDITDQSTRQGLDHERDLPALRRQAEARHRRGGVRRR